MDIDISYLVAPIVGGIIGFTTNAIVIKMLFHPHEAKYFLGIHIPFTPGLVAKQKDRLAGAIGRLVSDNLMNKDVLEKYLLSNEMTNKVRQSVQLFLNELKINNETVRQFLLHYISEDEIETLATNVNQEFGSQIESKLNSSDVGDKVAQIVVSHVIDTMRSMDPSEFISGIFPAFKGDFISKFINMLRRPAEQLLSANINSILRNNGTEIVAETISEQTNSLLNTQVSKLLDGKDEQLEQVATIAEKIYRTVITEQLPRILQTIDISKIISGRINDMNIMEAETYTVSVISKELKTIVWLGAILGALMGLLNNLARLC